VRTPAGRPTQGGRTSLNGDSRFAYLVGTSMATPQVAGVAALIRAVKPNMPNTSVVHLIKATASHCGTYGNGIGWGIVRADEAVIAAFASRNGRRYHRIGKTKTSPLTFRPKRHGRYAFYSVAVDNQGNRETPPPTADAELR
jgi:Subtilase family